MVRLNLLPCSKTSLSRLAHPSYALSPQPISINFLLPLPTGVAYAPHRLISCSEWGVDAYVMSLYKMYGPHLGALYIRNDLALALPQTNHYVIPSSMIPYKLELGVACHEGVAGIAGVSRYFERLATVSKGGSVSSTDFISTSNLQIDRSTVVQAFDVMTAMEKPLMDRIVSYLTSPEATAKGYRMIRCVEGPRVPTITFVHKTGETNRVGKDVHATTFSDESNGHKCVMFDGLQLPHRTAWVAFAYCAVSANRQSLS